MEGKRVYPDRIPVKKETRKGGDWLISRLGLESQRINWKKKNPLPFEN